jgi:hypothetical protein
LISIKNIFAGTLTQTSKSTSSVSDYLSGGKKTSTMLNNYNAPVVQSNKFGNEKFRKFFVLLSDIF